jgi:tetratricopeptide (TPR) repeat protein
MARERMLCIVLMVGLAMWGVGLHSQSIVGIEEATNPDFYLKRGEARTDAKQYGDAIGDFTMAIRLHPNFPEAYNDRGFAYYLKGDFEQAISDFTRAIDLRPNYPKAFNSRGVAYMQGGYGAAKSVPDFDRAISLKPDFRYAYINRANARLLRHPWLALRDFHQAGMHPERIPAVLLLAVIIVLALALVRRRLRASASSRLRGQLR